MINIRDKYPIKVTPIENGKGCWGYNKVEIFKKENNKEKKIGEYVRNYHSHIKETFEPFTQNGKDYALFSKNYTCTELMELPSCKIIGGEKPGQSGFCPVELYVPSDLDLFKTEESYQEEKADWLTGSPDLKLFPVFEGLFGFVAGCVWGDDSSWKLEFINLKDVANGIIDRTDKFGYFPLIYDLRKTIPLSSIFDSIIDDTLDLGESSKWINTEKDKKDVEFRFYLPKLEHFSFDLK